MAAVSHDLGNSIDTTVPVATRVRRPGWRDPRLWLGVLLVTVSVVGGARLLAAADDTVPVWAAADTLSAGTPIAESALEVRRVRFADGAALEGYFDAAESFPDDLVLQRSVGAGELVPRSAVANSADVDTLRVPLEVAPHQVPPSVRAGSVIDVYLSDGPGGRPPQGSGPALEAVVVAAAPPAADSFAVSGARQIVVTVSEADATAFQERYAALEDPTVRILQRS